MRKVFLVFVSLIIWVWIFHFYLPDINLARAQNLKPVDLVIFTHPSNKLEIIFLGFGEEFTKLFESLQIVEE